MTSLTTPVPTNAHVRAAGYNMVKENKEILLRRMQDLLANMTPDNQDTFLAELNVSAQATLEPLSKDATTVIDVNQPNPPNPTQARAGGLFTAVN